MITTMTVQKMVPPQAVTSQVTFTCRGHSHLVGCRPSHKQRARDAREIHSVSRASFGTELGRPLMCVMLNKLHNIVKRFPSRCFIKSQHSDSALLSDTTFCVDDRVANVFRPMGKLPPDVDRRVLGCPAASVSECSSIVTALSSSYWENSHTARGMCSRSRPMCCVPTARLHLQSKAMSGLSDAKYASLADTL